MLRIDYVQPCFIRGGSCDEVASLIVLARGIFIHQYDIKLQRKVFGDFLG